jgi:DNA-binding NarL/FixJ family response regulator
VPIRVLIADDHHLIRQSLRRLLEHEGFGVVGEASNGQEAVQLTGKHQPDVIVMDIAMPLLNGIDAMKRIQALSPNASIILLSMHVDLQYILEGLQGGAMGYIFKTQAAHDLPEAIRKAVQGGIYLSAEISKAVIQAQQENPGISKIEELLRNRNLDVPLAEKRTVANRKIKSR